MNILKRWYALVAISVMSMAMPAWAVPQFNASVKITQPDGSVVDCRGNGDEYGYRLYDQTGRTLIKGADGYVYYAAPTADGDLKASTLRFSLAKPAAVAAVPPGLVISGVAAKVKMDALRRQRGPLPGDSDFPTINVRKLLAAGPGGSGAAPQDGVSYGPLGRSGSFTNLVILARFKDTKFTLSKTAIDDMFNSANPSKNSGSLYDYYQQMSNKQLAISSFLCTKGDNSDVNVICYEDVNPMGAYCPYDAKTNPIGDTADAGAFKRRLYQWVIDNNLIPTSKNVDADGNGNVDAICLIYANVVTDEGRQAIKDLLPAGYDLSKYNPDVPWASALWPHSGGMGGFQFNGKNTSSYIQQLEWASGGTGPVGVFCHEMGHLLGAPDFYRYNTGGEPVGGWSHMAGSPYYTPVGIDVWTRCKYHSFFPDVNGDKSYGVSDIAEITKSGKYTLYPALSIPVPDTVSPLDPKKGKQIVFKVASKKTNQIFVLEYRKKEDATYDRNLPSHYGMLIYRVRTDLNGNAGGPPDELYIYRPGENKYTKSPAGNLGEAAFAADWGRTDFNSKTDPKCFLEDNSDGGIVISQISAVGDTISFVLMLAGSEFVDVTPAQQTVEALANSAADYVVTASKTSWAVKSAQTWAKVSKKSDSSGFTVTATSDNNTGTSREAEISVSLAKADTVVVKFIQKAQGDLIVNPGVQTIAAAGGSAVFTVEKLPEGVTEWTVTPDAAATWLTVTQDKTSTPPKFTATATVNTAATARSATIKVAAGTDEVTVKVNQDAGAGDAGLVVTPDAKTIPAAAGSAAVFSVTKLPDGVTTDWTATPDAAATWLTVTQDKTATPPTFTGTATANAGTTSRTAEITVVAGTITKKVKVTQSSENGAALTVTPAAQTIAAVAGSSAVFTVESLPDGVTAWTASAPGISWLTLTPDTAATPPTFKAVAKTSNTSTLSRTAEVKVTAGTESQTVTVTQSGTVSGKIELAIDSVVISADATSAVATCSLQDAGTTMVEHGICWSIMSSRPSVTDNQSTVQASTSASPYQVTMTGLYKNKIHYVRAYAKSEDGTVYYSAAKNFTPVVIPDPNVGSSAKRSGYYTMILGGTIIFPPSYTVSGRGVVYGTSSDPTKESGTVMTAGQGRGSFSVVLRKTDASGTYHMRAYAEVGTGAQKKVVYGNDVEFSFLVPAEK
jgi:M6 family metalloprotease-like protein